MSNLERQLKYIEALMGPFSSIMDSIRATEERDRKDVTISFLAALFLGLVEEFGPEDALVIISKGIQTVPKAAQFTQEWMEEMTKGTKH